MICQAIFVMALFLAAEANTVSASTCHICGNFTIPFPFGTTSDCILDESFLIICNTTYYPPKPFLNSGTIEVLNISLDGLMRVASPVAADCYNKSGALTRSTASRFLSRFPISSSRNKFTTVGCDTHALVKGLDEKWKQMSVGCMSWCDNSKANSAINGTCSGIGCCQTLIPDGVKDFLVDIRSFRNHTRVHSVNPCSYAFLVESDAFKFSSTDLIDLQTRESLPVVLDWSVGTATCHEVFKRNLSTFACKARHSECTDSGTGIGYLCKCLAGFEGNPYTKDGCQDINECAPQNNPCHSKCRNLPGSHSCSCPKGFEGNGRKDGSGCHPKRRNTGFSIFYIASGLIVLASGGGWTFRKRKQNKVAKLRRGLFHSNGGNLLENMLSNHRSLAIFTFEDLEKATNNYSNVLWTECPAGGKGYGGVLSDGTFQRVEIHRCKVDEHDTENFISRLFLLSQIKHRNVVNPIGCCLETRDPMVVYELVSQKTLYDYIQNDDLAKTLSWDIRLRIAAETARALAYLHSDVSMPIFHGNLTASTILLSHGYMPKVHYFGFNTVPNISNGYRDPEYLLANSRGLNSCRLSSKSDVYSFGLVLVVLLTGQKVVTFCESGEHFINKFDLAKANGDGELVKLVDTHLAFDTEVEQVIEVAKLARKCLSWTSSDRPTMNQVALALDSIVKGNSSCGSLVIGCPSPTQTKTIRRVVRFKRKRIKFW